MTTTACNGCGATWTALARPCPVCLSRDVDPVDEPTATDVRGAIETLREAGYTVIDPDATLVAGSWPPGVAAAADWLRRGKVLTQEQHDNWVKAIPDGRPGHDWDLP